MMVHPDTGPGVGPGVFPVILAGILPDDATDGRAGMDANAETRWLTYDALAEALGITPDSARRLVNRRKWPRKAGNDGKALVAVPSERLTRDDTPDAGTDDTPEAGADVAPGAPHDVRQDAPHDVGGDARALIAHLEARVSELSAEVTELRPAVTEAASLRGELAGLRVVLDAERRRADELRADRDKLVDRLSAPPPVSQAYAPGSGIMSRLRRAFG